jgi:membrane-associated phospholipid phosphatase
MNNRLLYYAAILLIGGFVFLQSCQNDDDDVVGADNQVASYDAESALLWHNLFLNVERYADGYRPGPAPRALAYMGLASYEACITGMPEYNSMALRYSGLDIPSPDADATYHWPTVVHGVFEYMMPRFFTEAPPSQVQEEWDALIRQLDDKYLGEAGQEVFARSKAYGEAVGEAVWTWSTTDPYGHEAYKDPFGNYTTGETYDWEAAYDAPGDWEPAPGGPDGAMFPYIRRARTFAISETDKLCLPPSTYFMEYSENPNSEYYSQAVQVYTKNATLDYVTEWIGEFWSDDLLDLTFSPGPRWVAIANQIIEIEKADLATALECYAKVGLALGDAQVACWNSKFHYNVERPVTYIRKVIDPTYETNLYNPLTNTPNVTPAFPAFPSGHSTMGAAAAEALGSVFGYSYRFTDKCHLGRGEFEGTPRTFGSFYEAAQENAWSRVLLGVHWRMDADEGMRFGTALGRKINALPWKK